MCVCVCVSVPAAGAILLRCWRDAVATLVACKKKLPFEICIRVRALSRFFFPDWNGFFWVAPGCYMGGALLLKLTLRSGLLGVKCLCSCEERNTGINCLVCLRKAPAIYPKRGRRGRDIKMLKKTTE